ncbi:hypothetical protein SADUNF_Sadunf02G0045200 [Salix dunnii]|uniref:Uncharacterized protein n=1 Tax=Salix dunnii TaxID=1413687 RepID=A0A835N6A4_9ROSI|nr:hypothetical protein SADUNF_Sadunf02G0045200 [Salix dunnii]
MEFCGHRREDRLESCSRRRPWNRKIEFDCCNIHRIFTGKRISVASTYSPPTGRVPITIIDTSARKSCFSTSCYLKRAVDRKKQQMEINENLVVEHYAVNVVDQLGGGRAGSFSSSCLRLELYGPLFHAVVLLRGIRRLLFCEIAEDSEKIAIQ